MAVEIHPFISGKWQANLPPPFPAASWFANGSSFAYFPAGGVITSIFLGTFPTYEVVNNNLNNGYNFDFYYGALQNNFWPILSKITGMPVATANQCFLLLNSAEFGLSDILAVTNRSGNNNDDVSLNPILFNNLIALKKHFPNLKNIYVTSGGSGPINNGALPSAGKWLHDSFKSLGHQFTGFSSAGFRKVIHIQNQPLPISFNYYALYSPSSAANRALQGTLNGNLVLSGIVNALPVIGNPIFKLRVLQWSFLLNLNGFAINPAISQVLLANNEFLNSLW